MRGSKQSGIATAIAIVLGSNVASEARADELPRVRAELGRIVPASAALELEAVDDVALPSGERLVRFVQRHRGLPVLGRGVTVELDASGRATHASSALVTSLPDRAVPDVSREAAARAAEGRARMGVDPRAGELVVAPLGDEAALVWRFLPHVEGLPFAPEILVDARTGAVRRARERAVSITARMYRANPFKTPGLERLEFPIAPTGPTLASEKIAAKTCVDRGGVRPFPGAPSGVRACELLPKAEPSALGDYLALPADAEGDPARDEDEFAEVSMYYHLGRVYSFFERLAPPGTARIVAGKSPFLAVANLRLAPGLEGGDPSHLGDPSAPLAPYSNAFFAPGSDGFGALYGVRSGALWFGQGPKRDYAYDGDVVYHEFTHAVVDATLGLGSYTLDAQGLSAAPGAINEGLADYFSSALAGDPDVGEYAASDIGEGLHYVRTLANDDRCPAHVLGEVHYDSTAFSGALWAARASLSEVERVIFDRLLYRAMLANARFDSPTFDEFIAIVLHELDGRSSLGARALRRELEARGFLPGCTRTVDATDRTVTSLPDEVGRLGFQSPGKLETGLSLVPGVVTFTSAVREGALVVRFGAQSRGVAGDLSSGVDDTGTAYQPTVLARFDAPITWHGARHDAPVAVDARADGHRWSAAIPVPDEASVVYVQIANSGDKSGLYDGVRLSFERTTTAPVPSGDESATVAADDFADTRGGCAVAARPDATTARAAWLAVAAVGLGLRRRKRR